ncbi:thermonuclease family protein [Azospirillum sp.]|uniref:thermonuclease family protein n=1 Tax=Azospirillum sp. TaxID=34012 RepID=UPI003D739A29
MTLRPIHLIAGKPTVLSVALAVLLTLCPPTAAQARELSVISGTVIDVNGKRIRLWGIRAPETDTVCRLGGTGDSCAAMSRWVLERFIGDEEVRCLVMISQPAEPVGAQCSVQGNDLGHLMVLSGWARDDGAESGGFYSLQEEVAREQRVGMWKGN